MEGSASQAGFYYQNNIAALKIIECLFFDSDITHIRLENYDKGNHIDDVIIYRKDKIDYYQVKWSNDGEKAFSLYNLLTAEKSKKSLFKQLAEGYTSVRNISEDFTVILFTTKRESNQRRPSEGLNHGLTDIRKKIFEPLQKVSVRYDSLPEYKEYQDTIEAIRNECALDQDSFNDFIKKLEFKFSQETIDQIQNAIKFRLERLGIEINLFEKILDGVVNWSISGEQITKLTVLGQLGITDRFEDKLSHYFKIVDDKYYVPNKDLLLKLETSLSELQGGYIFIEGLPGIGKSTTLSKFKETTPDITLAYYCFIPDAKNDFGELRHQSYYFLKSLCISIEKQFPEVHLPNKYSERFEEKFASYIDKLGTLNRKIIFIIDGLDHVHRDTTLNENSLLNRIKGNLPDGIYFILSSQYKAVLSSSVAAQIGSDTRRHIIVNKFTQREIQEYLRNKEIDSIEFIDRIEKLSGGIPLYLHYISELLLKSAKREHKELLENLPNLVDGKINSYHEYLFQKTENDEFAKWVLAVFANRKESSSAETICEILKLAGENKTVTDVSNVINTFSHLLRQTDGRTFSIFHNSFREFILSKTEFLKGRFNKALALFYEKTPDSDEAYRNYFKHLKEIGNYEKIISTTTLDWIKSAWGNFRTIEEISDNIDIALSASIDRLSLSEFIRIAYLKAQFSRLSWNLKNSEIDFPTLLLNAGETANSLRSIWDGDFVLTNKEYFCFYLGKYYQKTGSLLPQNVIEQGLSKSLKESKSHNITTVAKAKALVLGDIIKQFGDIDSIRWVKSDRHKIGYHKENFSEKENDKTNLKIKLEVIDYLIECKEINKLLLLSDAIKSDKKIHAKIQIALVKLLVLSDKSSAFSLTKKIDLSIIPNKSYFKIVSYCSDYLTNSEVLQLFPMRVVNQPGIYDKLINKEEYFIHESIFELFDSLKPIWIYKPEIVTQLLLRVSSLQSPAKNIYSSIFYLSELWNKNRTLNLAVEAKMNIAKLSIKELYVPRLKEYRKTNKGLFDQDNDHIFIASSIKYLFNSIFHLSAALFSNARIKELVNYWFTLEASEDGYRHHTIALGIAMELNSSRHKKLTDLIHKLIQHAEKIARYEEETTTLTNYIGEVANTYGTCGFKDDFKRIYNQLIEISFGLYYKKDYQSSYITTALELLHKKEPGGTLSRLSEVLQIQNNLADVGKSRMHHICLSELITFTMKDFPELAFILLEKEESNLWREEAIDRVLEPVINNTKGKNLPLLFSIIKTFPRWDIGGTRDNFFLTLSLQLLKRAIELNEETFIIDILDVVKQNILVELKDKGELEKFSEAFIEAGKDYAKYGLPMPIKKKVAIIKENKIPQDEKFLEKFSAPTLTTLIRLFEKDYSEFEAFVQAQNEICLKNKRNQTFRNEYYRSKSTFEKFFKALPDSIQQSSQSKMKCVIRNFIDLKRRVIDFSPNSFLKSEDLKIFFNDFITETNKLFPDNALLVFVEKEFEKDKWVENILQFINENRDYVFSKVISEENVNSIIEQISILQSDNLLAFIGKWTSGKTNSNALLKIASRLVAIEPLKAKKILYKVAEDETDNLLFPRMDESAKLGFDIIELFIKSDPEFGKKFLLKSYLSQNGRYGDELIASLDKLLKYQEHFDDKQISNIFYESNLQYNKELAKGLAVKEKDYGFIIEHKEKLFFDEITIKYLIKFFNYPVVKVRELTLQSVFDLVKDNTKFLKIFFKYGIENANNNQIEHSLVVLQSISFQKPEMLLPFKSALLALANCNHFNILESLKELLLRLNHFDNSFLSLEEITTLSKWNTPSPILYSNSILNSPRGKNFLYSSFQTNLLKKIYDNEDDETEIQDDLFTDLVRKGFGEYDVEKEGALHRNYNINTNFDTIEIQSPYYDEVKNSINCIFHSKIKRGCFPEGFVLSIKPKFRLYDPSKLLVKILLKPSYINWLPEVISENDFNNYTDFDTLVDKFVNREPEYLTLVEFGNQRSKEKYNELQGTCYFDVFAYLKKKGFDDSILENGKKKLTPIIKNENHYAYELSSDQFISSCFPIREIKPLIEFSYNNFRGKPDLISANLLSDLYQELGIEHESLLHIMQTNASKPIEAFMWQNEYTSSGRRRYKPTSEGFTLKIRKELLLKYLSENNLVLCYDIELRRSTTKSCPEEYMNWYNFKKRIEAILEYPIHT